MRKRALLVGAISISLLALPTISTAIEPGSTCKKVGVSKKSAGKTFLCVSKGKKKVWRERKTGNQSASASPSAPTPITSPSPTLDPTPAPTPTPMATPTPLPSPSASLNLEEANRLRISLDPLNGKSCINKGERINNSQGFLLCEEFNSSPLQWHQSFSPPSTSESGKPTDSSSSPYRRANNLPSLETNIGSFSSNLDECRLKETMNISGAGSKGFPIRNFRPTTGTLKIAIIPIDFSNAIGEGSPGRIFEDDLEKIVEWSNFFGRGKLSYKPFLISKDWLRAPKGADWYVCVDCRKGATSEKQSMKQGLQELINLADEKFDFADTDFVYFVFPESAERNFGTSLYFHDVAIQTKEGVQEVSVYGEMGGAFEKSDRTKIWDHLIHELLHFQGFIGHGPLNQSMLGILMQQWGNSKAVTAWEAFMAGWFNEDEIICLNKEKIVEEIIVNLSSLDNFDEGKEVLMIRLNSEELIVIERRTTGPFSDFRDESNIPEGDAFTAYVVNVNKPSYRNDIDPDSENKNFWRYLRDQSVVGLRSSISYGGVTVEVRNKEQLSITRP